MFQLFLSFFLETRCCVSRYSRRDTKVYGAVRSPKKRGVADTVDQAEIHRGIDKLFRGSIHQRNLSFLHNSSAVRL